MAESELDSEVLLELVDDECFRLLLWRLLFLDLFFFLWELFFFLRRSSRNCLLTSSRLELACWYWWSIQARTSLDLKVGRMPPAIPVCLPKRSPPKKLWVSPGIVGGADCGSAPTPAR